MIPLAIPDTSGNEARYLQECVETNFVSSVGPFVDRLEGMVAKACGATTATATSSGTTGLHAALVALGVEPGDLVLLPSFTFIASANAVSHCGATPWLVDVSSDSWNMDPEAVAGQLEVHAKRRDGMTVHRESGRRVAAIMPVYTMGTPADMDALRTIADEWGVPIVADAAAALGARYKGRELAELADLTVFSFNGNKTVTAGGGGAVAGNDATLVETVRHLCTTARVGTEYHHDRVGFNYRMTNIQAAVGCAQLERLDEFVAAKRQIRRTYDKALACLSGVGSFPVPDWSESACWFSGLVVDEGRSPDVAQACQQLQEQGIGARSFWKPVHLQPPYADAPKGDMRVTELLWQRVLPLPCSTSLTSEEQTLVIEAVLRVFK